MSSGEYSNILVERRGAVGIVTLNRPQALNALNAALVAELGAAFDDLEADPAIGAIILTGNDKAFAAGADIKEMADKTYIEAYSEDFITQGWERDVAADRDDGQGGGQPRLRDDARRGGALRAPPVPLDLCYRGPERGHGRLRRQAQTGLQEPLSVTAAMAWGNRSAVLPQVSR